MANNPQIPLLNATNYNTWSGLMTAYLQSKGIWRIVSGAKTQPFLSDILTARELAALKLYHENCDKAYGIIYLHLDNNQKIHLEAVKDDPIQMWEVLKAVYQKCPGNRFNAYDDLFSIQKVKGESLQTLINRVEQAVLLIQQLRPKDFDLAKLDEELALLTLIRALPDKYNAFALSLLHLDKLDKAIIHQAFVTEDIQHSCHASDMPAVATAFQTTSAPSASKPKCAFCDMTNHVIDKCHKFINAQKEAKKHVKNACKDNRANKAQEATSEDKESKDMEFSGNASALNTNVPSFSTHSTDFDWIADTGATSHMTSHCNWV
ncbi:hypothetical protein CVT25_001797 [Psilocybe cyanescens]|uniref:Uncharacterized protein n=1 Tax=Psilocybe cyanescens TaxID=93625 RepID=A0A409XB83_PSICY|nr:hypothetical protein CVT25_001797 [Psilocybe cyanescens]